MGRDTSNARATAPRPEIHLETLYLALSKRYPDDRVMEILGDLSEHGIPLPYVVDRVQCECGAIDAGRLRRLASSISLDVAC